MRFEADRELFYAGLKPHHLAPLWEILRDKLTREPTPREVPYLWPWHMVRSQLLRAGELVSAAEAERRVLVFVNPENPARIGATATLYAAMQLILPGETARAHRHSPSALRFVVEGQGAFTCVDGEKVAMSPGDLILTPPQVWHDHGNEGKEPVLWLDGLDIPLLLGLRCMFFEDYSGETQPVTKPAAATEQLYGRAFFPGGTATKPVQPYSPVWAYRWKEARAALEALRTSTDADPWDGHLLRYVNPATGGEVLPTLGCRLQLLTAGSVLRAHRHTSSTVYHVAEGRGHSVVNGVRLDWAKGDTFAVPLWCWHQHAAIAEEAVLFALTDEPVLAALGQVRTEVQ